MIGVVKFKKDPSYLLKNNRLRVGVALAVNAALLFAFPQPWGQLLAFAVPIYLLSMAGTLPTTIGLVLGMGIDAYLNGFEATSLLYAVAALVVTFPVTSLYHSAAHQAMRPLWLNRMVGELCGLFHTSNLDEWSIIHHYHHRHADDLEKDPHPPAGQGFIEFARTTGRTIGQKFAGHYFEAHAKTPENLKVIKANMQTVLVRQNLLTLFWLLALGPTAFVYFFAVNIVFKKVHYAWFNWATHVTREGKVEILNQDEGLYKLINLISFNLYFHKNHHLRMGLFNPKAMRARPATAGETGTEAPDADKGIAA